METILSITSIILTGCGIAYARAVFHHWERQVMIQNIHDTVDDISRICKALVP